MLDLIKICWLIYMNNFLNTLLTNVLVGSMGPMKVTTEKWNERKNYPLFQYMVLQGNRGWSAYTSMLSTYPVAINTSICDFCPKYRTLSCIYPVNNSCLRVVCFIHLPDLRWVRLWQHLGMTLKITGYHYCLLSMTVSLALLCSLNK